ncbi:MAG TPA: hypothetical protein PK812_08930 [Beijerinckiaceae bacterium]|nr:hypothetical protein [Beijerinckiaceae bacterium]
MRLFAALLAVVLIGVPAAAQSDPAARFAARPPAPFTVAPSSHPGNDRALVINSRSGKPTAANADGTLCKAAFKAAPSNAKLSQQQINGMMSTPEWRQNARAALEQAFSVNSGAVFSQAGVSGLEFVGTPKIGPGAAKTRVYLSMAETPAGRTTLSCATLASELETALPVFRAIRASLTMP